MAKRTQRYHNDGPAMVSVRQRSADFFVRYAIVDADRQGVTGPLEILECVFIVNPCPADIRR